MNPKLQERLLAVTPGTKFGAIVRCALNVERDAIPRFHGKAMVTSDGYVMANFYDSNGEYHMGAFVGSKSDLVLNVNRLAAHLDLTAEEKSELATLIDGWLGIEFHRVSGEPRKKAAV